MKKLFAIIMIVAIIFTLCSCRSTGDDISDISSYSEPADNSQIDDVGGEQVETEISSEAPSSDESTETVVSNSENTESSNPAISNSSKEEISTEEPKEPINFVPNKFPSFNSDTGKADYENATISYSNNVCYKGVRYAATSGKNNGIDCFAIVTVGDNDEYLNCISIMNAKNNDSSFFNVYNDRIYFLQYETQLDSARDYELQNTLTICSMNLSGGDRKIEKKAEVSFTHISIEAAYLNSKYLFFTVTNVFDRVNSNVYRYNMQTNELVELTRELGAHRVLYSIEERVFVWSADDHEIHEYDIDFAGGRTLIYSMKESFFVTSIKENGFNIELRDTKDKYFVDFSGNVSKR